MTAIQIYVAGSVESWTVAGAFGQRRFVALTPVLTFGLAALLTEWASGRLVSLLTTIALVAACWWNIGVMAQFGAGMMNRQKLEPSRIAYNTFVVMPRALPRLAWRYVVDRGQLLRVGAPPARVVRPPRVASAVRILYLADIRFPLERANGLQTFETCRALAARGHAVTLLVRPDTTRPARDPWLFYGAPRENGPDHLAAAPPARPLRRGPIWPPLWDARSRSRPTSC
jgi:hypothetical protein